MLIDLPRDSNVGEASLPHPVADVVAVSSKNGAAESVPRPSPTPKRDSGELPPWKRGKTKSAESSSMDVDIVVAAPSAPTSEPEPAPAEPVQSKVSENVSQSLGIKPNLPSTFKGDRGGAAEDEELLAELRAISAKSSGAHRFAEDSNVAEASLPHPVEDVVASSSKNSAAESVPRPSPTPKRDSGELSPWKRGKTKSAESSSMDVEIVVAAPSAPTLEPEPAPTEHAQSKVSENVSQSLGIKPNLPSTFKGDRGGAAEDEELLAELRAISAKSSGAHRFAEDSNVAEASLPHPVEDVVASSSKNSAAESVPRPSPTPKRDSGELSPWKRGKTKSAESSSMDVEIVVAAPSAPTLEPEPAPTEHAQSKVSENVSQSLGIKPNLPSTFKGDRGGAAEDEELLAELRAISAKSSGAHRFAEDSNVAEASLPHPVEDVVASSSKNSAAESVPRPSPTPKRDSGELSPWKRGKTKSAESSSMDVEIVVAAPSAPTLEPEPAPTEHAQSKVSENVSQSLGIKPNLPSTFKGDRGGAAEDEELLAELRAISAKSSGAHRFAEDSNVAEASLPHPVEDVVASSSKNSAAESVPRPSPTPKRDSGELSPWKRGKTKSAESSSMDVEIVVAAPSAPTLEPEPAPTEPVQSKVSENVSQSLGIKSNLPSTFKGDRGGAAEDEELLAELRAISAKSSGAHRFAEGSNVGEASLPHPVSDVVAVSSKNSATKSVPRPSPTPKRDSGELPPWKRGKTKSAESSSMDIDIVVAAPSAPSSEPEPAPAEPVQSKVSENVSQSLGIKSNLPSTFKGDRGGAAKDDELLAELRAISAKSSGAKRFAEGSNVGKASLPHPVSDVVASSSKNIATESVPRPSPTLKRDSGELPPWKRGKKKSAESSSMDIDIVVAAPSAPTSEPEPAPTKPAESKVSETVSQNLGIKSNLPSTFNGGRGGAAEDAELLAELRAISMKSSSAVWFAEGSKDGQGEFSTSVSAEGSVAGSIKKVIMESASRRSLERSKSAELHPWKRGQKMAVESSTVNVDIFVATPPSPAPESEPAQTNDRETAPQSFGIKSSLPSTFKGDRGGSAEDDELLAELRAISMKSSSADRFIVESKENGGSSNASEYVEDKVAASSKKVESKLRSRDSPNAPKPESVQLPPWKREKKKAEGLLEVNVEAAPPAHVPTEQPGQSELNDSFSQSVRIKSSMASTLQGDRGGPAEGAELRAVSSQPKGGMKSDLPNTFKGDRGGSAEDAELLAELRAVSSAAYSANRFSDEPRGALDVISNEVAMPAATKLPRSQSSRTISSTSAAQLSRSESPFDPSNPAVGGDAVLIVTRETLPSAVTDRNWKLRKEAHILLRKLLADQLKQGEGNGTINGDMLMPGLDDAIPSMISDSNAGALDTALEFAVDYAEHCTGASSSELASKIVASLIKGNALSSSRPSTGKFASALTLKLMEVGGDGYTSVHAVSEVLLAQGLSSRKPKVVIASSDLILQAAYSFGAGSLPLATISSTAPKMLSHSNPTVRETGLKIVAEICRALGSKDPLQGLVDGMKKAQQSQLDSMLVEQPEPTPIGAGLRSSKGSSASQSPADALAALEAGSKGLEAQRFAERDPVNIFQALSRTDYSTRIKLPKWSEKVAALDLVLECGGEKPYKLVQPSSSVNYAPLISEMKKLLSHSHFVVASKSMKVLSMLAEGVGSGLYPHLRPLLGHLVLLSKDKKLNRAVGECLDILFGNVLEIAHLLDEDDALPSVLNEKVQKNALVRVSALDFLGRCIKRRESAGPRGRMSSESAATAALLCCEKLDDSDAAVRKAATESLRSLLLVDNDAISDAISPIIESLRSKNSRVYKSLKGSEGAAQKETDSVIMPTSSESGSQRTQPVPKSRQSPQGARKVLRPSPIQQTEAKTNASNWSRSLQSSSRTVGSSETRIEDTSDSPSLEEAISMVASIHVPSWDAPDDDGGVLAGLKCKPFDVWAGQMSIIFHFTNTPCGFLQSFEVASTTKCDLKSCYFQQEGRILGGFIGWNCFSFPIGGKGTHEGI